MVSEKRKISYKKWCERNKDRLYIIQKRYRAKHKDKVRASRRAYYFRTKERSKLVRKLWIEKDPEKFRKRVIVNSINYRRSEKGKLRCSCRSKTKWYLISIGIIYKKRKCQVYGCKNYSAHIHHWDYNNHLDFSLVCEQHHLLVHNSDEETLKKIKKFKPPIERRLI